jgi:hypothetical protein
MANVVLPVDEANVAKFVIGFDVVPTTVRTLPGVELPSPRKPACETVNTGTVVVPTTTDDVASNVADCKIEPVVRVVVALELLK